MLYLKRQTYACIRLLLCVCESYLAGFNKPAAKQRALLSNHCFSSAICRFCVVSRVGWCLVPRLGVLHRLIILHTLSFSYLVM